MTPPNQSDLIAAAFMEFIKWRTENPSDQSIEALVGLPKRTINTMQMLLITRQGMPPTEIFTLGAWLAKRNAILMMQIATNTVGMEES